MVVILMDMFTAGAETTSTTLTWAIITLIQYYKTKEGERKRCNSIITMC